MKALEILERAKVYAEHTSSYPTTEEFNEAIEELEDLKNRKCENCKYNKEMDGIMVFCDKKVCKDLSKMMWHPYTKNYCCRFWEAKQ